MITCGWCGTKYSGFQPNCKNCGGALPHPPGMDAGEPPPDPPRRLPKGFERRVLWTHNVFALVGGIFLLVGVPLMIGMVFVHPLAPLIPLIHCTLGYFLLRHGRGKAKRMLNAFVNGKAIRGDIKDVFEDTSISVNNRHPWAIAYGFDVQGQIYEGTARTWDADARLRSRGQHIWVLAIESDPEQNTIYPPVK